MFNVLIGGAAGDGIETMAGILEKILLRSGFYLFSMRDFMSRVRGGHNFALIRFGNQPVSAHRDTLDGLVVFNKESYFLHKDCLSKNAFVLCDKSLDIAGRNFIKIDGKKLAKEAGNPKSISTVYIGALLKLFGISDKAAASVLQEKLPPKILDANIAAAKKGYAAADRRFSAKAGTTKNTMLLTGSDAMAMGALAGNIRFYSAYPMSPSTTLLEFFSARSGAFRIGVEQAEDEIAAVNMALGASYTGARSMVGTSGGGFALMVEALGFAGIAEIPIVIADIQRPGPSTGLPTRTEQSDLSFVISASQGEFPRIVIAVKDHADAFYQTARAFYLAEKYQVPVILLSDQYLADSAVTIPLLDTKKASRYGAPAARKPTATAMQDYLRYKLTKNGISPLAAPGKSVSAVRADSDEHDERGVITESAEVRIAMTDKRNRKTAGIRTELQEPDFFGDQDAEVLLVGFGSTAGAIKEAVEIRNKQGKKKIGALCFSDVYPLPAEKLLEHSSKVRQMVNVEQNSTGQLAKLIRQETLLPCTGSILKYDGRQISPDEILDGLKQLKI
ncbi:2-oxoacid:acceptor oxidoreductase subunit alpha [Breznakiella homolactica]|uniref:2-oxoacid:acceptor oxidoreductase subunit alpha n=1 Tax=Breznakiella homolactica TaxID=2798577 RepID=A0A7T7XNH0_9SPIR|nr:2-oxoacid:acceptor oxidoreductase subunit alpha [Breznakiella homolactica]QQO09472.1 2-oxoacid:acceptor oxidoreductase subunit alpha [Breznakiella homolactica]